MRTLRRFSLSGSILAALTAVVVSATVIWLYAPLSVDSAYPGGNGRIAFESSGDGDVEIYTMNPDGSSVLQLTFNEAFDGEANYSADGARIAFSSDQAGAFDIWTMDSDGSNRTNLTDDSALDFSADWSPDGSRIAFSSNRDGDYEIYVMDADGGNIDRLTFDDAIDYLPKWSPDGTKIAFQTNRDGNGEIYVMEANGDNPTNLTNHPSSDGDPDWSPDGSRIAFMSYREDLGASVAGDPIYADIFTMDLSGGDIKQLTSLPRDERDPRWSPDGTKIVYTGNADGGPGKAVVVMDASDGANKTNLTGPPYVDSANDWQPLVLATPTPTLAPIGTPLPTPTLAPIESPIPTPTLVPIHELAQGDDDCDGDIDPVDALVSLRHNAGFSLNQQPGCPALGGALLAALPAGAAPDLFGDVDCDDDVDSVDALKILRSVAAFSVTQNEPCVDIGDPL
ncbi:MAG: PD40 domain-containing protein [Chloroflexi bacterium]|nr:PD40 domain-containing protein [Chloroflexota bacterium]